MVSVPIVSLVYFLGFMALSQEDLDRRLAANSAEYCANVFKVKPKGVGIPVPLVYNRSQLYLERFADRMLEELGRVRMLVVKGRQIGCTQWFASRCLRKLSQALGANVYTLAHDTPGVLEVRDRVEFMIQEAPGEYRPKITAKPGDTLKFGLQQAAWYFATAGSEAGPGRGSTIQFFHGLEVSRWPNAEAHRAGVMEAVALQAGTEIVLETTSAGHGGMFYEMCMDAQAGRGLYRIAFCPWWWDDAYRLDAPAELSRDEEDYARIWGLDEQQASFLHHKNRSLGSADGRICLLMKQEYPANVPEAFEFDDAESYIPPLSVSEARMREIDLESQYDTERESILGVDVGRTRDPTFFCDRLGRVLGGRVYEEMESSRLMDVANRIAGLTEEWGFDYVYIDLGREGAGVVDRLRELGYDGNRGVFGVDFGWGAEDPVKYLNKRVEMHGLFKDWLTEPGGASIPDDDMLQGEAVAVREIPWHRACTKLEPKEDVKKRIGRSTNRLDAAILTFGGGQRVRGKRKPTPRRALRRRLTRRQTSWMAR